MRKVNKRYNFNSKTKMCENGSYKDRKNERFVGSEKLVI